MGVNPKYILVAMGLFVVVAVGYIANEASKQTESYGFICPSAYTSGEEYLDSIGQWVTTYKDAYPDATEDEMIVVRAALAEKIECGPNPFGTQSPTSTIPEVMNGVELSALLQAIKHVEGGRAPGISENPTEEEVYANPFVRHIRTALTGYLDGSNNGVEDGEMSAFDGTTDPLCGIDAFDKAYYKSKFVVLDAGVSDYGGVTADIVFVDKPDIMFWAWVYDLAEDGGGDLVLRAFCNSGPADGMEEEFAKMMKVTLPSAKWTL